MNSKRKRRAAQPRPRYIGSGSHLADIPTGSNSTRAVAEDHPGHVRFVRTFLADGVERVACAVDVPHDWLETVLERSKKRRGRR